MCAVFTPTAASNISAILTVCSYVHWEEFMDSVGLLGSVTVTTVADDE